MSTPPMRQLWAITVSQYDSFYLFHRLYWLSLCMYSICFTVNVTPSEVFGRTHRARRTIENDYYLPFYVPSLLPPCQIVRAKAHLRSARSWSGSELLYSIMQRRRRLHRIVIFEFEGPRAGWMRTRKIKSERSHFLISFLRYYKRFLVCCYCVRVAVVEHTLDAKEYGECLSYVAGGPVLLCVMAFSMM